MQVGFAAKGPATANAATTSTSTTSNTISTASPPSSTPYDDGMWHTTYYHEVTSTGLVPFSTAIPIEWSSNSIQISTPTTLASAIASQLKPTNSFTTFVTLAAISTSVYSTSTTSGYSIDAAVPTNTTPLESITAFATPTTSLTSFITITAAIFNGSLASFVSGTVSSPSQTLSSSLTTYSNSAASNLPPQTARHTLPGYGNSSTNGQILGRWIRDHRLR